MFSRSGSGMQLEFSARLMALSLILSLNFSVLASPDDPCAKAVANLATSAQTVSAVPSPDQLRSPLEKDMEHLRLMRGEPDKAKKEKDRKSTRLNSSH